MGMSRSDIRAWILTRDPKRTPFFLKSVFRMKNERVPTKKTFFLCFV